MMTGFIELEGTTIRLSEIAAVLTGGCTIVLNGGTKIKFRYNHGSEIRRALDAWHSVPAAAPEPRGVPLPTRESLGGPGVNTWHSVEEGGE